MQLKVSVNLYIGFGERVHIDYFERSNQQHLDYFNKYGCGSLFIKYGSGRIIIDPEDIFHLLNGTLLTIIPSICKRDTVKRDLWGMQRFYLVFCPKGEDTLSISLYYYYDMASDGTIKPRQQVEVPLKGFLSRLYKCTCQLNGLVKELQSPDLAYLEKDLMSARQAMQAIGIDI
jgi:hypothetical protein